MEKKNRRAPLLCNSNKKEEDLNRFVGVNAFILGGIVFSCSLCYLAGLLYLGKSPLCAMRGFSVFQAKRSV